MFDEYISRKSINIPYELLSEEALPEIIKEIRNNNINFVYKKYYIKTSPCKLFDNLRKYKFIIQQENYKINFQHYFKHNIIKPRYLGKPLLFINDEMTNYYAINVLSDFFSEKCRILSYRYDKDHSPYSLFHDDEALLKILKKIYDKKMNITWENIREEIYKTGVEATNFKLTFAISIYKFFKATRILDISAGWGDRLISAIALNHKIQYYHGVDPSECMEKYYQKIIKSFHADPNKYSVQKAPFEKAIINHRYDLVFTSPPYFNLEIYVSDDMTNQSTTNYNDSDDWFVHFLAFSLFKAWHYLDFNGFMVVSIEDIINKRICPPMIILYVEKMVFFVNSFLEYSNFFGVIGHKNINEDRPNPKIRPIYIWKKISDDNDQHKREKYKLLMEKYYYDNFTLIKSLIPSWKEIL